MSKIKLAVLVSGNGTNLQSIIDNVRAKKLYASVEVVISDNEEAYALERARANHIPIHIVNYKASIKREETEDGIIKVLRSFNVELVVLAGYMKLITSRLINAFYMKIMNIHPALLPSFPGVNVIKKAFDYGVKFTGCTVHFIDEGTDTGPIIIQAVVPIRDTDSEETLANRIHEKEHIIYPLAIQLYAEGRLFVQGRRVLVKDYNKLTDSFIINPFDSLESQ